MTPDELKSQVDVCMFDQYGTVVDMQGGLVKIATPFLKEKGWTGMIATGPAGSGKSLFASAFGGTFGSLSQVGVSFQKDGMLALDATKLQAAIDRSPDDLAALVATDD